MMFNRRTWTRAVSIGMFCAAVALAEPAKPPADTEALLAQLASDDWRARQRAQSQLVDLGEPALPRLSKLAETADDEEVRTRARAAMAQIEQNRLVGMSLITLNLQDVPVADALAEITRQSGGALPPQPANLFKQKSLKRVSLKVDREPFWGVMQTLCAQAELEVTTVSRNNRETGLALARGGPEWIDKPTALAGPLLIRADRLMRHSALRLRGNQTTSEFTISLTAFAEPKLKVLDVSDTLELIEVVDERGNSLIPPEADGNAANVEVYGNTPTSRWDIGATLHYPKGVGRKIAHFKAKASLIVQVQAGVLEVPVAAAKNARRTVGGLRMTVQSVDANRAEISVHRDGRTDAEWYAARMQLSAGEARLLGEQGQVLARSQSGLDIDDTQDGGRSDFRFRFSREGGDDGREGKRKGASADAPVTLQWQFPTQTRELSLPFEFRDLPIP